MESTAGVVNHCVYARGTCAMKDGTHLLWEPNKMERSEFLPWQTLPGKQWAKNWLADDGNLALTWTRRLQATNCQGWSIHLSDQGIPFELGPITETQRPSTWTVQRSLKLRHKRRGKYNTTSLVTSDVLASSLQAVSLTVDKQMRFAFAHAMNAVCKSMELVTDTIKATIVGNPTLAIRVILGKANVYARAGGMAVEVWPCQELPKSMYTIRAMNGTCTKEIPVDFSYDEKVHRGYLDPTTNIIQHYSIPTDCALAEETPVMLQHGVIFLYNPHNGELKRPQNMRTLQLFQWNATEFWPNKPTIFHEITMYQWTELQSQVSLNDLFHSMNMQQEIFSALGAGSPRDADLAARETVAGIMEQGFFGFLHGLQINWWQIWVFVCCFYVSFLILTTHCCPGTLGKAKDLNVLYVFTGDRS